MSCKYIIIDSPIGNLIIAKSQYGLIQLSIQKNEEDFLQEFNNKSKKISKGEEKDFIEIINQVNLYFQKRLYQFNLKIDWSNLTKFQRVILQEMQKIKYGMTISYSELAKLAGYRHHARAVGQVCKKNPLPIIIPCHRVIYSNGKIGNYTPDAKIKKRLIEFESL